MTESTATTLRIDSKIPEVVDSFGRLESTVNSYSKETAIKKYGIH